MGGGTTPAVGSVAEALLGSLLGDAEGGADLTPGVAELAGGLDVEGEHLGRLGDHGCLKSDLIQDGVVAAVGEVAVGEGGSVEGDLLDLLCAQGCRTVNDT
jgi:hypothetical protein